MSRCSATRFSASWGIPLSYHRGLTPLKSPYRLSLKDPVESAEPPPRTTRTAFHPTAIIATPPTSSRWEAPSGASILKHPRQGISTQFREYGQTIVNQRVGPL